MPIEPRVLAPRFLSERKRHHHLQPADGIGFIRQFEDIGVQLCTRLECLFTLQLAPLLIAQEFAADVRNGQPGADAKCGVDI